jgi:hypothetical protein
MITRFLLLLVSAVWVVATVFMPGWLAWLPVALGVTATAIWWMLRSLRSASQGSVAQPKDVIVDGSNVMHWKDGTPKIETVRAVVQDLTRRGYSPGVMFDANAGYLLTGTYQHDGFFGKALGLPQGRVMVVPKGTPADPHILNAARDKGARIVTNDRFRDWRDQFPEARKRGHLIRGGFKSGQLWLELRSGKT